MNDGTQAGGSLAYYAPPPRHSAVIAAGVAAVVLGLGGLAAGLLSAYASFATQIGLFGNSPLVHRVGIATYLAYTTIRLACCAIMLMAGLCVLGRRPAALRLLIAYVLLEFLGQLVSMLPPGIALAAVWRNQDAWWQWLVQITYVGSTALFLGVFVIILRTHAVRALFDRATGAVSDSVGQEVRHELGSLSPDK